ncbi:MAG: hypothetical protein AAF063_18300 [Cyanobacteria bacterium J06643_5]
MNIYKNTHNLIENSLKIGSAILLVIGASLLIPNAGAALNSNHQIPKNFTPAAQSRASKQDDDSKVSKGYEPPSNVGSPSSYYSSGTR